MAFQSMDVSSTLRSASSSKVQQNQMTLRPGQILSGKVLEIYPNQRASVQLGNQKFVAQLQTALDLDGEYFFQVQTGNKLVHLKVLTDIPTNQTPKNQASALLKQLQLPVTKENLQFVKQLITSEIPFRPSELKQALQMQQGKDTKGSTLIIDMMRRQLPITVTMYGAMSREGKQSLNMQLQNLQSILAGSSENEALLNRIKMLLPQTAQTTNQNDLSSLLSKQIEKGDQAVIELVRQAGISKPLVAKTPSNQQTILSKLNTLAQSQLGLTDQRAAQFQKIFQYSVTSGGKIAPQQLQDLQMFLSEPSTAAKMATILTGNAKQKFVNWQRQPSLSNLVPVVAALKKVADQQITKSVESKLVDLLNSFSKGNDNVRLNTQNDLSTLLSKQIQTGDQATIQLVKQAGISSSGLNLSNQQQTSSINNQSAFANLKALYQAQVPLTDAQTDQFHKLVQTNTSETRVPAQQLQALQTFLEQPGIATKIATVLIGEARQNFANWQQQGSLANLEKVFADLKKVADQQVTKSIESKLTELLNSFSKGNDNVRLNTQNDLSTLLSKQIQSGDQETIQLLKHAGISTRELNSTNQQQASSLSTSIDNQSAFANLKALFQAQVPLTDAQTYQFQKLVQSNTSEARVSSQQLQALQTFLEQPGVATKIATVLTGEAKQNFINWQKQGSLANLEEVFTDLKKVAEQQLPKNIENKLTDILAPLSRESGNFSTKEQFLLHTKQFLSFSGLDYEHQLLQENSKNVQQENSLKQLVLQSLQSGQLGKSELESLLQTLNGMQLASVNEEAGFLQTSMQLPGLFGLEKDVKINFESKKGEDGQINPDYCRVVFYLSLEKMGDTMIDMSIQKRVVQLTIHNKNAEVAALLDGLKPLLQQGLEKNDYQLSAIKYKQITAEVENESSILPKSEAQSPIHQGVDYRI